MLVFPPPALLQPLPPTSVLAISWLPPLPRHLPFTDSVSGVSQCWAFWEESLGDYGNSSPALPSGLICRVRDNELRGNEFAALWLLKGWHGPFELAVCLAGWLGLSMAL